MPEEPQATSLISSPSGSLVSLSRAPEVAGLSILPERLREPTAASSRYLGRDQVRRRLLGVADAAALCGWFALALLLTPAPALGGEVPWALLTLPVWIVLLKAYGLYDGDTKRISHTTIDDIPRLFHAVLVGTVLLWLFFDIGLAHKLTFLTLLVFGAGSLAGILALRSAVRGAMRRLLPPERVLILGEGQLSEGLVRKLQAHPEYALEPVGVLTGGLSDTSDLKSLVELQGVDRLILADADTAELVALLSACRQLSLKVSIVPTVSEAIGPATQVDDVEGVTVLGLNPPVLSQSSQLIKRAIDVVVAGTLLLLALPVLLVAAVAIKLDSSGPVLFAQRRVGKGGKPFKVIKLRTMVDGAEVLRDELLGQSSDPHWVKLDRDPRVTTVGALLRKTSVDELPQLWNVLRGQMSLVGPRPLPESEDRLIEGWGRGRLDLKPGITGYWQVLGRTNIPFTEMVKLDYMYVTNWSLWTDIRLLLRTLPAVISARGVN